MKLVDLLKQVNSPQDLKKLSIRELEDYSKQVRERIIEVVANKGGHLASSLGAVELCVALHYCFDTPKDTLIFDVGHQAYAHKIVTGRNLNFETLRQHNGISGFPNPFESVYDEYFSGHASTAISWGQGVSEAKKIKGDNSKTIAVVGDGSLTGGMCFEALNSCGHNQSDLLVILNHNQMSISASVGALSRYLTKIISAPVYNRIRGELKNFLKHFALMNRVANKVLKFEEALKNLIIPGIFFEELGFRYFGPIDGHNLKLIIETFKNVSSLSGPRLLHVITKKGKGYNFAEKDPQAYHGTVVFDKSKGASVKQEIISFSDAFGNQLINLAHSDSRIVAITAAMPSGTGLAQFQEEFQERFFDVGIAEEHAVGFASGFAKKGLKPVVAIYSTFLQRAFDQIIHDVALQKLGVVFAVDRAGVVGEDGPTHHGVFDIAYLRAIPEMVSMAPKDKEELEEMLSFAMQLNCPTSIRYPKGEAYSLGYKEKVSLGKAQLIGKGKDVCIIALGSMVKVALEAMPLLEREGIGACVVNARFIKPLDNNLFLSIVKEFPLFVTIEEASLVCGFGSAILEFYEEHDLLDKIKVIRLGLPDKFIPSGNREKLLGLYGLSTSALVKKIKIAFEKKVCDIIDNNNI